jgi:hypothetical protein
VKLAASVIDRMVASMKRHGEQVDELLKLKLSPAQRRRRMASFPSDRKRYIIQRSGRPGHSATCSLIALANAKTYLGHPSVRPGSSRWTRLVKLGGCVYGPCTDVQAMAIDMGLSLWPCDAPPNRQRLPFFMTVWTPDAGYHSVLVIATDVDGGVLVNYESNARRSRCFRLWDRTLHPGPIPPVPDRGES